MAVFMLNICKFKGCGITFPRLPDLIEHIEDVHIDLDPKVVEQKEASQPQYISLSYVLRYISDHSRRDSQNGEVSEVRRRLLSLPDAAPVRSPTGSEMDEDETLSHSEDSNDSWTTVDEYNSDFILRYGVKLNPNAVSGALGPAAQEKPFACPVPGCKKRYKNVNGIKYHSKNGHKKDGKVKKVYKCKCGKSYKTAQSLKIHSAVHTTTLVTSTPTEPPRVQVTRVPGLVVTAAPARNLTDDKMRIYDTIKTKDGTAFTIPKHGISRVSVVSAGQIRHAGIAGTVTSAPIEKMKVVDRNPKVTVYNQPLSFGQEH